MKIEKLYGVAPPSEDGHIRITRSEDFEVVGGSQEHHEKMREIAIKVDEGVKKTGRRIQEVSSKELVKRIIDATEKVRGK